MGSLRDGGGPIYIDEGEFKNFDMDLIIPSQYTSQLEYMEKFMNIDVGYFLDSSRDFVVQGEMLKLFLVLQPPKSGPVKLAPKPKEDLQPNIGYHVDVRLRNPEDFVKTGTPLPSSKQVSKTIMISNPKHGHVRHTPKLNSEYDTETANNLADGDTATSTNSDASTATTITSTISASTVTTPTGNSPSGTTVQDDLPKGPISDFVAINSPASATKAKNSSKPNFFRLPDGTIIFPIEIPVGVKSKYNNRDISVVVSVARVMQPPPGGPGNGLASTVGGKLLGDALHTMFPGSPMAHQYVTSATKLEKLLSTQYPQYWQYSQYSRGGMGNVLLPTSVDPKGTIHNSHSNPNLVGLGGSGGTLTRTSSSLSNPPSTPSPTHLSASGLLSNNNSRSDPNISSLEKEDTLSPLPTSNLMVPTTPLTSRGSSGNLYGMGQLQTSTSSTTLSFASLVNTGGTSHATTSAANSNIGVSSGAPVSIKTAQKIVRVLEPLQVRLLQHYSANSLKLGTKRLIPVAVSNTHPTLPIIVRGLQLVLSNIPSLEGSNGFTPGPVPDIFYNHVSVTDKYKTSTLDIETFPVTVVPGDEYHFVVAVEPHSPSTSSSTSSIDPIMPPPPTAPRHSVTAAQLKRRVIHTLQAQLVITWSIPCSPGSILSIHPLPVSFPAPHDLLVSFDSKSPVRVQNVFNVCFTITNLSDYSRDLTFIIPRPVCVTGAQSSSVSISTSTSSLTTPNRAPLTIPRSPPPRPTTLPTIKFTAASMSTPSLPTIPLPTPTRIPSHQSVSSAVNSASTSSLPSFSPLENTTPEVQVRPPPESEMAIDEDELLTRFGELQSNSASMLCLEKTLYVGLVKSNSSVSVNVRYIPLREGLFEIQGLQIFDRATDQVYVVQDTCQLYVIA